MYIAKAENVAGFLIKHLFFWQRKGLQKFYLSIKSSVSSVTSEIILQKAFGSDFRRL